MDSMAYSFGQQLPAYPDSLLDPALRTQQRPFPDYEYNDAHLQLMHNNPMPWHNEDTYQRMFHAQYHQDRPLYMPIGQEELNQATAPFPAIVSHHHHQHHQLQHQYDWTIRSASNSILDSCASTSPHMTESLDKSPSTSPIITSAQPGYSDVLACGSGSHLESYHLVDQAAATVSVAPHQVQIQPETTAPESIEYDDSSVQGYHSYCPPAEEGYQPMYEYPTPVSSAPTEIDSPEQIIHSPRDSLGPDPTYSPSKPTFRTRRTNSGASMATTTPRANGRNKVTKTRSSGRNRASSSAGRVTARQQQSTAMETPSTTKESAKSAFRCLFAPYGCGSTFGSKNEWKRHINTQHMRWDYWQCDQCDKKSKPNNFNRKDLYIQHVRRMHPPTTTTTDSTPKAVEKKTNANTKKGSEKKRGLAIAAAAAAKGSADQEEEAILNASAARCYHVQRQFPALTGCLFCDETFRGERGWDERLEHIGKHMENAKKQKGSGEAADTGAAPSPSDWNLDSKYEQWLLAENIIVRRGGRLLCADHKD